MSDNTLTRVAYTREQAAELAAELERRSRTAKDYVVQARGVQFEVQDGDDGNPLGLVSLIPDGTRLGSKLALPITHTAHAQLADTLGIPKVYYDRMLVEDVDLLATNVNHWAQRDDRNRLLRTIDYGDGRPVLRAWLSDRYRALDNVDLFFGAIKTGWEAGAEVSRVNLTDDKFELRMLHREWREGLSYPENGRGPVYGLDGGHRIGRRADSVFLPGIYLGNSETGRGGLTVRPFLLDMVCSNGLVGEASFSQVHLGGRLEAGYLSRETVGLKDQVLWAEVRDLVRATFDEERFRRMVRALGQTTAEVLADPVQAVSDVAVRYNLPDADRQAILNELISPGHDRDPGRTVFGLISAITERARTYQATDPDRATGYEEIAGDLVGAGRQLVAVR